MVPEFALWLLDTRPDTKPSASDASHALNVGLVPANSGILGRCNSPLTPKTRVRFPLGLPEKPDALALLDKVKGFFVLFSWY